MKYNISVPVLKERLSSCKPSKDGGIAIDLFEGTKYLYKNAIIPTFAGRLIKIGDLDFDTFDFEDTIELSDFLDGSGFKALKSFEGFCQKLRLSAPQNMPVSFV